MARFAHPYRRPVDGVIRRMKYGGIHRLTPQMGTWIANMLLQGQLPPADVVVPVPMHARRLRERGYNHAALLAKDVADQLGLEYMEPLTRVRHTKQQALLNWNAREGNMIDAFSSSGEVDGLRVLLIDDVLTSGATAVHCALALKAAGAEAVYVATLAGAVD